MILFLIGIWILQDRIAFKIDKDFREKKEMLLDSIYKVFHPDTLYPMFRFYADKELGEKYGLDLWYAMKFSTDKYKFAEKILKKMKGIKRVDPIVCAPLRYIPSDSFIQQQWGIFKIMADKAWDICKGSEEVILAIPDGGVDWNHPDLITNIWVNPGEDIDGDGVVWDVEDDSNGIDDDGNGLPDDFIGWDWVNRESNNPVSGEDYWIPDNDPMDFGGHGTHCAGIASAVADNDRGIAGVGFKCKIMCLRVGAADSVYGGVVWLDYCKEALIYAADKGATAINMSWGTDTVGYFLDACRYAYSKGVLLIEAAGNDNVFFDTLNEAGAIMGDTIMVVAATNSSDHKAWFSNYGYTIDISAPGVSILSTVYDNSYVKWDGTSMAAPFVTGAAGLLKAFYPQADNKFIFEHLKLTADSIDHLNPDYAGKLGSGRLNVYRAIATLVYSKLKLIGFNADDSSMGNGNGRPEFGDTVLLRIILKNAQIWQDVDSGEVRLHTERPEIKMIDSIVKIGRLDAGFKDTVEFKFTIIDTLVDSVEFYLSYFVTPQSENAGDTFKLEIGYPDILLVDDDKSSGEDIYISALRDSLKVKFDIYNREKGRLGDLLKQYKLVIWFTGGDSLTTLEPEDTIDLKEYLNGGGALVLSGRNIGNDIGNTDFYRNYLKAEFDPGDESGYYIYGVEGNSVSEGLNLVVVGQRDKDALIPVGSETCFVYGSGRVAAVRYEGDYSLYYFGFGLEGIRSGSGYNSVADVLERILKEEGIKQEEKREKEQFVAYYKNPVRDVVKIRFKNKVGNNLTLELYDNIGRLVGVKEEKHFSGKEIIWDLKGLSPGIYFLKIKCGNREEVLKLVKLK